MGRLAERRRALGISQEALARAADCSTSYVVKLEADDPPSPTVPMAQRIALALDTTVDAIWPPQDAAGGAR